MPHPPEDDRKFRSLHGEILPPDDEDLIRAFGEVLAPLVERFGFEGIEPIGLLLGRLLHLDPRAARRLLENGPSLLGRMSSYGAETVLDLFKWSHRLLPLGPFLPVLFLESSPCLLNRSGRRVVEKIVLLLAEKGRTCPPLVSLLLERSEALLNLGGLPLWQETAECCFALGGISPSYAQRILNKSIDLSSAWVASYGLDAALGVYRIGTRMAATDWYCALDWLNHCASLIQRYDKRPDLLAALFEEADRFPNFHPRFFLKLMEKTPEVTDLLGEEQGQKALSFVKTMGQKDPEQAVSLMQRLPEIVRCLKRTYPPGQLNDILQRGESLMTQATHLVLPFLEVFCRWERRWEAEEILALHRTVEDIASTSLHLAEAFLTTLSAIGKESDSAIIRGRVSDLKPLARISWEAAVKVMRLMPAFSARLSEEGWRAFLRLLFVLAEESGSSVNPFIDRAPALLMEWSELGGKEPIEKICLQGVQAARQNARVALSLIHHSGEWIRTAGWEGWEKIQTLALALGRTSWTAAAALVQTGPRYLERFSFPELERFSCLVEALSRENAYAAESLVVKGPDLMEGLQAAGAGSLTNRFFLAVAETSLAGPRLVPVLMDKGPLLFSHIGSEHFEGWLNLLAAVSRKDLQAAVQYLEATPELYRQIGLAGMERTASLLLTLGSSDRKADLSGLEKIPDRLRRLLQDQGAQTTLAVLDLTRHLAQTSMAVALKILEKSSTFIEWVGLEGFGLVAAHLQDLAATEEEKALALLSSDSPSWVDFLEHIPKGLELEAVKPVLSHYLKALLGRRVEIIASQEISGDGRSIYLPRRVREFQDPEDNFLYYKVAATHEEAHLEYGSYEFELARLAVTLQKEIPADEGPSDLERFFQTFPEPALAQDVFHLLEDRRIEKRLTYEYPALGENLFKMHRHQAAKRGSPVKITHPKERAVAMIKTFLTTGQTFPEAEYKIQALIQGLKKKIESLDKPEADVYASARMTYDLYAEIAALSDEPYRPSRPFTRPLDQETMTRQIGGFGRTSRKIRDRILGGGGKEEPPPGPRPEGESGGAGTLRPTPNRPFHHPADLRPNTSKGAQRTFQGPQGGGRPVSAAAQQEREDTSSPEDFLTLAAPERIERLLRTLYRDKGITPKEVEKRVENMNLSELFLFLTHGETAFRGRQELTPEAGTFLYPEWAADRGDYRSNWTRVREQTLKGGSPAFYQQTIERYAPLLKKIRREFQALKTEGLLRQKRQYDGNEIDLEAAVEFWSDRKAGLSPPERLYRQTRRRQRDIAVAFLVDMSRSTRGEVLEREKEALIILSEALQEVGDVFAVYGFSGDNRDNVEFYLIKDFDEPYDQRVQRRIAAVTDRFENRDGAAVRHATEKLRRRTERTRLLILISDGKPVDKEYAGTYAVEDTRLALKEAERLGIKTFCITVDQEAPAYLPRMYSHSHWTLLDRLEWLPEKITRLYRRLTR
jgi:hypothetical protein